MLILSFTLFLISCVQIDRPFSKIPPGIWRAVLVLEDDPDSNRNDLELPFNFEIEYQGNEELLMTIINDTERIQITDIKFGRDRQNGRDTVRIDFPVFDTHISAEYKENILEGFWHVHYRENYKIPFIAYHGQDYRFQEDENASSDLSGKWDVKMEIETETEYNAIGDFSQNGNSLSGTFLTETGDYRFLQGIVKADHMYLSCFDGSHAFYFDGRILETGEILGRFLSGTHYKTNWSGVRTENPSLTDPFKFSIATNPDKPVNFEFPNADGKIVSLSDERYSGKPKIVQIMGTWCPNCMDESRFLTDFLKDNPNKQIDIIAVAFERYREIDKSIAAIKRYKEIKQVPYEVLYGGYYNKQEASKTFKILEEIKSYPTLIFLDGGNRIRKIHTGFAGPATYEYAEFKFEFETIVNELLAESPDL